MLPSYRKLNTALKAIVVGIMFNKAFEQNDEFKHYNKSIASFARIFHKWEQSTKNCAQGSLNHPPLTYMRMDVRRHYTYIDL